MLQVQGKVLDVEHKEVRPEGGRPFTTVEVAVMTGKADVERVRLGLDFKGRTPEEGQEVSLGVLVSAFATRNGAGFRLVGLENLTPAAAAVKAAG